jgi:hypothetical protein
VDFKEQKPMISDREERNILDRYIAMKPYLYNEQLRRIYAASEAKVIGYGGITILSKITGLDRETISRGIKELENPDNIDTSRVRNIGGGRKKIEEIEPEIKEKLQELMESSTCGSPQSALKWTKKSLHNIEAEMKEMGFEVSHTTIHRLLTELDYSMQGNQKAIEGNSQHPDRNEQFEHINSKVKEFQEKEQPVISVGKRQRLCAPIWCIRYKK